MAAQTPVNRLAGQFRDSDAARAGLAPRASQLAAHVIELGELQFRLLMADVKSASRRLMWFAILAIVGGVALLGAVPVALYALGLVFQNAFNWPLWAGLLLAAGIALLVGALLLGVAVYCGRSSVKRFDRSTGEFRQNLQMLKALLANSPDYDI